MERRLGRGLGSLLSKTDGGQEGPQQLPIRAIRPNRCQPREAFDAARLEELKTSIQQHGILQPIVVRRVEDGFELVAGERRWRAARLAGLSSIPASILEVSDEAMLELALVENVQRADLDPIEKAKGFKALQQQLGLTQDEVAGKVGLRRSTVTNHLRLLELPQEVQEAVSKGVIRMGHARALLALKDAQAVRRVLEQIGRDDLSVREVERLVRESSSSGPERASESAASQAAPTPEQEPWAKELERRLGDQLGTKVKLDLNADLKGQISIRVFGREDLDRLIGILLPKSTV